MLLAERYPSVSLAQRALRRHVFNRVASPEKVFTSIYQAAAWGPGESVSGGGSSLQATERVRAALPTLVAELGVRTFMDAPCGDHVWMRHVELGCDYIGVDVVAPLIADNVKKYGGPRGRSWRRTWPRANYRLATW